MLVRDLDLARGEPERRSQLLGGVARAARTMNTLDPDLVLTAVVHATLAAPFGFDAAGFLVPKADRSKVSLAHPPGGCRRRTGLAATTLVVMAVVRAVASGAGTMPTTRPSHDSLSLLPIRTAMA